jgi:hypothetical protein
VLKAIKNQRVILTSQKFKIKKVNTTSKIKALALWSKKVVVISRSSKKAKRNSTFLFIAIYL